MVDRNRLSRKKPSSRAPMDESKRKGDALGFALSQIEKQFGKGAIMRLGGKAVQPINGISTGALSLDIALGGRGIPRGRVAEIFGPEASGKTTLCSHLVAEAQKNGGTAAFIDAENAYDPAYARKIGVNLDELLISQPDTGEQALEITEMLVRSSAVDIVVIDSVAALVPKAEIEGDMGDVHVGLQARLMSQALRKLTSAVARSKTALVFTNQLREKIGVMFGSPETTPGGRALKYYASIRIDLRRIGMIKDGDVVVGNRVRAKVVKNKIAPPFRMSEFDILFDRGISFEGDLIDLAVDAGVIAKQGSWYSHGKTRLGQGRERVRTCFLDNPDLMATVRAEVLTALGVDTSPVVEDAEGGEAGAEGPPPGSSAEGAAEAGGKAGNGSGQASDGQASGNRISGKEAPPRRR